MVGGKPTYSQRWLRLVLACLLAGLGFSACTSRTASEETDLAEPDIAVVPDTAPPLPRGEIKLVDGLLATKRLPAGAFRALTDLMNHRDKAKTHLYDRAIKELVKVACEHDDPLVAQVIEGSTVEEIYPMDRLRDADAAGCGMFWVNGKKMRGALFENGCFAARLTQAGTGQITFDKCPVLELKMPKIRTSSSPTDRKSITDIAADQSLGSAADPRATATVLAPVTMPMAVEGPVDAASSVAPPIVPSLSTPITGTPIVVPPPTRVGG
jgi:hypothetical protein